MRFRRLPEIRILIAIVFVFISLILRELVMALIATVLSIQGQVPRIWLGPGSGPTDSLGALLYTVLAFDVTVGLGLGAYWLYVRLIERRPLQEFDPRGALGELASGMLVGVGLVLPVVVLLAVLGYVSVVGTHGWLVLIPAIAASGTAAFMEELAVRGILLRLLEERLGSWIALVAMASLFGILHHGNSGATWISTLSIAISAGLGLGAIYLLTRRLWMAIGLHFAVNLMQGGVFGMPVSGGKTEGIIDLELSGPAILTGGAFGIEASILVLVLGLIAASIFLRRAVREGRFRRPSWSS